jgi:cyclopropane fatty-acyl-phospholipid synthase-like methyltransferase
MNERLTWRLDYTLHISGIVAAGEREEKPMNETLSIDGMPLHMHLDRIERGLATLGVGPDDAIEPEQLFALDQWHFGGTDAVKRAAEQLGLQKGSRVLDIGAGLGGPARVLAQTTGCQVTALELQPRLHEIGVNLTRRCGLGEHVSHVCGDALTYPLPGAAFDAVVSWMAVHHIPDRRQLCARLARALRPGGGCYIEDLYMRAPFSAADMYDVRNALIGNSVSSIDDFMADLQAAALTQVERTDLTDGIKPFVAARVVEWRRDKSSHSRDYGEEAYAALETSHAVIARLFEKRQSRLCPLPGEQAVTFTPSAQPFARYRSEIDGLLAGKEWFHRRPACLSATTCASLCVIALGECTALDNPTAGQS